MAQACGRPLDPCGASDIAPHLVPPSNLGGALILRLRTTVYESESPSSQLPARCVSGLGGRTTGTQSDLRTQLGLVATNYVQGSRLLRSFVPATVWRKLAPNGHTPDP